MCAAACVDIASNHAPCFSCPQFLSQLVNLPGGCWLRSIPFLLNLCHFPVRFCLQFLSKLVNLQGIVTRCTLVRPKIIKSVHW